MLGDPGVSEMLSQIIENIFKLDIQTRFAWCLVYKVDLKKIKKVLEILCNFPIDLKSSFDMKYI